jgi:hypothetical protein
LAGAVEPRKEPSTGVETAVMKWKAAGRQPPPRSAVLVDQLVSTLASVNIDTQADRVGVPRSCLRSRSSLSVYDAGSANLKQW